jgi:hypothetical protein
MWLQLHCKYLEHLPQELLNTKFGIAGDLALVGNWKHIMAPYCEDWFTDAVNTSHMHMRDKEAEDMLCSSHLMKESEEEPSRVCQHTEGMGRAAVPFNAIPLCSGGQLAKQNIFLSFYRLLQRNTERVIWRNTNLPVSKALAVHRFCSSSLKYFRTI